MLAILIPVLLSLIFGPGVGQLYNKEFKKGLWLIGASFTLLIAFSIWLSRAAMPYLPTDIQTIDRSILRDIIQTHIVQERAVTFYTYEVLLALLWVYGVVDATLGGMRRREQQSQSITSSTTPEGGS